MARLITQQLFPYESSNISEFPISTLHASDLAVLLFFFSFLLLEFIKSEEVHSRMGGHVDLSCTRRVTFNPRHFSSKPKQTIALGNSELLAKIGDNTAGMYNLAARPKEYGMRELSEKLKM